MEDIEKLQVNRQELAWLYRAMDIIRANHDRQWRKYVDETEQAGQEVDYGKFHEHVEPVVAFDTKVRECFIWFADIALRNGQVLINCRKVAVLIELGDGMDEIKADVIAALVEIDEWIGNLRTKTKTGNVKAIEQTFPDGRTAFDAAYRQKLERAVELKQKHGDEVSIADCLKDAGIDSPEAADQTAFQRTKQELGVVIPKGKPGPKPKRLKESN